MLVQCVALQMMQRMTAKNTANDQLWPNDVKSACQQDRQLYEQKKESNSLRLVNYDVE